MSTKSFKTSCCWFTNEFPNGNPRIDPAVFGSGCFARLTDCACRRSGNETGRIVPPEERACIRQSRRNRSLSRKRMNTSLIGNGGRFSGQLGRFKKK